MSLKSKGYSKGSISNICEIPTNVLSEMAEYPLFKEKNNTRIDKAEKITCPQRKARIIRTFTALSSVSFTLPRSSLT